MSFAEEIRANPPAGNWRQDWDYYGEGDPSSATGNCGKLILPDGPGLGVKAI